MAIRATLTIGNEPVRSKTDKLWNQSLTIIDKAGATEKSHRDIVAVLKRYHLVR